MTARLVVVGTPIGNLDDISPRAVRALTDATVILCEDTRRTRRLLSALGVPAPRLVRLDHHTEAEQVESVVGLVRDGSVVALVSDAGMPTISDPGHLVVDAAHCAGLDMEVVPGPCAVSAALALSGFPASEFRFVGFLPRRGRERRDALAAVAGEPAVVVIYEAPGRVAATLADLAGACGADRRVAVVKEITKVHETVWRASLGEATPTFVASGEEPRGEHVIVVDRRPPVADAIVEPEAVDEALRSRIGAGADRRQAIAEVALALGLPKRVVYAAALALKNDA